MFVFVFLFVQPASTDGKQITLVTLNEGKSKVLESKGNLYLALRYTGYSFYEKATILKESIWGGGGGGGGGGAEGLRG